MCGMRSVSSPGMLVAAPGDVAQGPVEATMEAAAEHHFGVRLLP